MIKSFNEFIEEGVFRNSIIRTSGTGAKRREDSMDYIPVDLGLPSGTLWCDRNVGATSPEDYGGYFQWAGTEDMTEKDCDIVTCPYRTNKNSLEDYNFEKYNAIDKKTVLDLEDDAAHVNMGGKWHMPTDEQCNELLANTDRRPALVGRVYGMLFKSKKNENSIFIPYAGALVSSNLFYAGQEYFVWSSSVDLDSVYAYKVAKHLSSRWESYNNREVGLSVRGVIDSK